MREYRWKHIEPLSADDRGIDLADIAPLYDSYRAAEERMKPAHASPEGLQRFTGQREDDIGKAFERWLDSALAVAIKEFGDRL